MVAVASANRDEKDWEVRANVNHERHQSCGRGARVLRLCKRKGRKEVVGERR